MIGSRRFPASHRSLLPFFYDPNRYEAGRILAINVEYVNTVKLQGRM